MRIPIVMPLVDVQVDRDGGLAVRLDGAPYRPNDPLERGDLRSVVEQITAELQSPVRVDVVEADGTAFADIATPPAPTPSESDVDSPNQSMRDANALAPGFTSSGFDPGEQVAITYLLARQTADADGKASLRLPPAILAAQRRGVVLVGLSSGRVTALSETL